MRTLLAVMLALVVGTAWSTSKFEFLFDGNSDQRILQADQREMIYIGESEKWILTAVLEDYAAKSPFKIMHSLTQYREPKSWDQVGVSYSRIWSYGYIDCRLHQLFILNEFYTSDANQIVFDNKFSRGEYIVDLDANIVLQTLFIFACSTDDT